MLNKYKLGLGSRGWLCWKRESWCSNWRLLNFWGMVFPVGINWYGLLNTETRNLRLALPISIRSCQHSTSSRHVFPTILHLAVQKASKYLTRSVHCNKKCKYQQCITLISTCELNVKSFIVLKWNISHMDIYSNWLKISCNMQKPENAWLYSRFKSVLGWLNVLYLILKTKTVKFTH